MKIGFLDRCSIICLWEDPEVNIINTSAKTVGKILKELSMMLRKPIEIVIVLVTVLRNVVENMKKNIKRLVKKFGQSSTGRKAQDYIKEDGQRISFLKVINPLSMLFVKGVVGGKTRLLL